MQNGAEHVIYAGDVAAPGGESWNAMAARVCQAVDGLLTGGDLIIVAGRPSMGKTSFSMNIGEHVAIEQGLPVAVFSMEMGAVQLAMRMLGSVGLLDQHRMLAFG